MTKKMEERGPVARLFVEDPDDKRVGKVPESISVFNIPV